MTSPGLRGLVRVPPLTSTRPPKDGARNVALPPRRPRAAAAESRDGLSAQLPDGYINELRPDLALMGCDQRDTIEGADVLLQWGTTELERKMWREAVVP